MKTSLAFHSTSDYVLSFENIVDVIRERNVLHAVIIDLLNMQLLSKLTSNVKPSKS